LEALARQCGASSDWLLANLWNKFDGPRPMASLSHLYFHIPELTTPTNTSLKLLEMPLPSMAHSRWSNSLRGLEQLDIECRLPGEELDEDDPRYSMNDVQIWNSEIKNLTNLRTLCLRGAGEWEDVVRLGCPDDDDTEPVWLDDLLQGVAFPHLQSLSLINWPVRETGLAKIIRQHQASLTLELRRHALGFSRVYRRDGVFDAWCRIAAVCAECPNVKRFSFQDLRADRVPVDEDDELAPFSGVVYWHTLRERMASQWRTQEYYLIARGMSTYEATPLDTQ